MATNSSKGSYQDYLKRDTIGKNFIFLLTKKNANPSFIDIKGRPQIYVGSFSIPNISIIRERDKNGLLVQRTIRYIPGESSIYKDEQSNDKDVPKKSYKITFLNGRKIIKGEDGLLLDFMMKCNKNATNPNRNTEVHVTFELFDNSIAVSKEIAKDKLISQVTAWCWDEGKWDEQKAYARVLNISLDQSSDEVKHNLKVIALRDPEKFIRELKNPAMRKKHYVLEAIDREYLVLDSASNSISWKNNPYQPIAVATTGMDPVDVLVNKLSTDEGLLMYQTIVNLLTPESVVTTSMDIPNEYELAKMKQSKIVVEEPVSLVDESDSELMDILESAIEKNIVTFQPPMWYKYKEESGKKKEGFVEKLKKNPVMLKSLKYEIQKANIPA